MQRSDVRQISLPEALAEGHRAWTAKLQVLAKVRLFDESDSPLRFFEVTNVIRCGFTDADGQVHPVTPEKDLLVAVEHCLQDYSGPHPQAVKYAKRLWERSAYLAQRHFDIEEHLVMLEALKPLFAHWLAELTQLAAHVSTLWSMLKEPQFEEDALGDLPALCPGHSLGRLQTTLGNFQTATAEQKAEMQEALECLQFSTTLLKSLFIDDDVNSGIRRSSSVGLSAIATRRRSRACSTARHVKKELVRVQELLEASSAAVLWNKLRTLSAPITRPLGHRWEFPSRHLPVGAEVTFAAKTLRIASWCICEPDDDSASLNLEAITQVALELLSKKDILCLQGCWPELLEMLHTELGDKFAMLRNSSSDKAGSRHEVSAMTLSGCTESMSHQPSCRCQALVYDCGVLAERRSANLGSFGEAVKRLS
ncbi:NLRC3 [Symbiodinium necroappetens]|uniref:NLRC3 protein n=1 Tax=Symbiodinium necroappetens TaxID=1628268 RepID=A0A812Z4E8_9DINO|nr:NLRC3 [Symbiodinium necroappetens]